MGYKWTEQHQWWMMMMMMITNCFCGMADRRKAFSLISSRDHCQRFSPLRISDATRAGFEPAQNLISGFCWMKLCNSDNHYIKLPLFHLVIIFIYLLLSPRVCKCWKQQDELKTSPNVLLTYMLFYLEMTLVHLKLFFTYLCECNGIRTHSHLVPKRTLNHLAKFSHLAKLSQIKPNLTKFNHLAIWSVWLSVRL